MATPKFNMGDRVRCVPCRSKDPYGGAGWSDGQEFEITDITPAHSHPHKKYVYWGIKTGDGVFEDALELASPTYHPITPKVGEKYRVKKRYYGAGSLNVGDILQYEEQEVSEYFEWFRPSDKHRTCTKSRFLTTEYLEPVLVGTCAHTDVVAMDRWIDAPMTINVNDYIQHLANYYSGVQEVTKPKKTLMSRLNTMMKKLLDGDTQTLIEAGYLNSELELTCKAIEMIQALSFEAHKAELVKLAKEQLEAEKSKK